MNSTKVTKEDRDAAKPFLLNIGECGQQIDAGWVDDDPLIQSFLLHRMNAFNAGMAHVLKTIQENKSQQ